MDAPSSWDALRKQARKLEAQLDEQMNLYRKLVSSKASTKGDSKNDVEPGIERLLDQLQQEFHRLRSNLRAKQEHASLLEDFREFDRTGLDLEDGADSSEQTLLREHATINRNTGQVDTVISQAQATLGALVFQRSTFGGINSKLTNVSGRLPTVNQILGSIKRKKSMDTIILSLVASVCTFLILLYWLTK
ncbi:Golgi SNAP receptor complex member 1-1 [Linum perenne]